MIKVCKKKKRGEELSLFTELEKCNWSNAMGLKKCFSVQPETLNFGARRAHDESNNPFYIVFFLQRFPIQLRVMTISFRSERSDQFVENNNTIYCYMLLTLIQRPTEEKLHRPNASNRAIHISMNIQDARLIFVARSFGFSSKLSNLQQLPSVSSY